jgi:two-component system response regulator YesN
MYSIILVDDESRVRDSMKVQIPWNEYGFSIIGEAENGLEALDVIEEKSPDVVITDIKMPYLDGLELIKEIRKNLPTTTIIILSGHDEFSFAQSAIKLNVTEYVLKPVSKKDMVEILIKLKKTLDNEIALRTDKKRLEEKYNNLIPAMKERIINEVYFGNFTDYIEQAKDYNFPIDSNFFITSVIEPQTTDDIKLDLLTIKDILRNFFDSGSQIIQSINKNTMILTFYYYQKGQEELEKHLFIKRTLKKIEELDQYIKFYSKTKCNIGVSKVVYAFKDLDIAYRQSINAINYKIYYKDQNIFYIGDLEPKKSIETINVNQDNYIDDLITAIKLGTEDEIKKAINSLFYNNKNYNPLELEAYTLKIISMLTNLALSYNLNLSKYSTLINKISQINTLNVIISSLNDISISLNKKIQEKRESSNIKFVEVAKKLIEQNYMDKNFNLDIICDMLGVSNAYFSSTFKKETKTAFTQALTKVRIQHAKALIESENLKTYQIADKVGFSDSNYFSFCFKKITGDSPSVYKQKMKK